MKNIFLLLLFLSLRNIGFSNDAKNYYQLLYKAYSSITVGDYELASRQYFIICSEHIKYAKPRDLRNYFKCAILSKKRELIAEFLKNAEKYNYYIEMDERLKNLISDSLSNNEETQNLLKLNSARKVNNPFDHIIDSLLLIDQSARNKCGGYNLKCVKSIISSDINSALFFKDFLANRKFQFELSLSENSFIQMHVMLMHWRQWGISWFDSILLSALKNGEYSPDYFASLIDYRSGVDSVDLKFSKLKFYGHEYQCLRINDTTIIFRLKDSVINKINENRLEIHQFFLGMERQFYTYLMGSKYFRYLDFGMNSLSFSMGRKEGENFIRSLKEKQEIY